MCDEKFLLRLLDFEQTCIYKLYSWVIYARKIGLFFNNCSYLPKFKKGGKCIGYLQKELLLVLWNNVHTANFDHNTTLDDVEMLM